MRPSAWVSRTSVIVSGVSATWATSSSTGCPWRYSRKTRIDLARHVVDHHPSVVEHDGAAAHLAHGLDVVGDEHDRPPLVLELADATDALRLEHLVADGEHLVDEQHVGIEVDRHGETEAHVHPRRVVLHRLVDELGEVGEGDDVVEDPVDLLARSSRRSWR